MTTCVSQTPPSDRYRMGADTVPGHRVVISMSSRSGPLIAARLIEHGNDVFRRYIGLDVMHAVQDVATVSAEDVNNPPDLPADLVGAAEGQHLLRIDGPPEGQAVAVVGLQALRVHAAGVDLDGIDAVDADVDEVVEQRRDGAATVQLQLGLGA